MSLEKPLCFAQIADVHMVGYTEIAGQVCPRLPDHAWWAQSRRYDLMPQVLPRALQHAQEACGAQFILLTGDQVDDGFNSQGPADLSQFQELVNQHATVPAWYVYGNHDGPQEAWEARHGALNYTFTCAETCFVVLNSGSMEAVAEVESSQVAREFLAQAVAQARGRRLVVVLHQWIHPTDVEGYSLVGAQEALELLQATPNAVAVLNGHYHSGSYAEVGGLHCCTARALCEPPLCYSTYELTAETLLWTEWQLSPQARGFVVAGQRRLSLRPG